jgi:flagellar biosynthesis GTPase FlhF
MNKTGLGGPPDVAEARRLFGLAAAHGHGCALSEAEQLANAIAETLLAEEVAEKVNAPQVKKKKKRGSKQVLVEVGANDCDLAGVSAGDAAAGAAATSIPEASNAALSEALTTSVRTRLRQPKKKERQRQRQAPSSPNAEAEEQAREQAVQTAATAQAATAAAAAKEAEHPPPNFICSITHDLMIDPVSAADGHTYERGAIEEWLVGHSTSPMTGAELEVKMLFPNHIMRGFIRTWQEAQRCRPAGPAARP